MATKTFHSDTDLAEKFGDWWIEEMDFRDEMSDEEKLEIANVQLEERGFTERATGVMIDEEQFHWSFD